MTVVNQVGLPAQQHASSWRWRRPVAALLAVHAIAHLVGTTTGFQAAADGDTLNYLGGLWTLHDPTALRVIGVVWAVVAAVLVATAFSIWNGHQHAMQLLLTATGVSLALCMLGLWSTGIGLAVNIVFLAGLAATGNLRWEQHR